MGIEGIICVIGFVVLIYFTCRPKPTKRKKKDTLTKEIHVRGLPPTAPLNSWIPPQ